MAKDPIKKAENGTYYFRANLGYDSVTGKQIQKIPQRLFYKKGGSYRVFPIGAGGRRRTGYGKRNSPRLSSTLRKFIFHGIKRRSKKVPIKTD